MKPSIPIVLIDLNETSRVSLKSVLNEIDGVAVHIEDKDFGKAFSLVRQVKPLIVILNLYPEAERALNTAKRIMQNFPDLVLFVTAGEATSEIILQSMRAGAREFLTQPIQKDEIISAVDKIIKVHRETPASKLSESKVISTFGTKGGVGTTMVATNIATSLAEHTRKEVVIVDLNLQFGTAALLMNIKPKYTILDVAQHLDRIDVSLLKKMLPKGSGGISFLANPSRIEDVENITPGHIDRILLLLRTLFDYIIVDTHSILDDVTIKALDESDHVLMISTSDVPSIYHAKRCLELFQRMDYDRKKLLFVINRYNGLEDMNPTAIEKLLDYPIFWRLPNHDYQGILTSVNKGTPISQMLPNAKLSQSLQKMILHFNGKADSLPTGKKVRSGRKLFSRIKA